jgi:hypothetical protein
MNRLGLMFFQTGYHQLFIGPFIPNRFQFGENGVIHHPSPPKIHHHSLDTFINGFEFPLQAQKIGKDGGILNVNVNFIPLPVSRDGSGKKAAERNSTH